MNIFKRIFKSKNQEVDFLANTLSNKTKNLTREEVKSAIISEGYSENIANKVIDKFKNNKFRDNALGAKEISKVKADKEKILKELSQSVKAQNKAEIKVQKKVAESKKDLPTVSKKKGNKLNIFKRIYFAGEDKYYDLVERVGLTKLTDKIDKVFPSFILFILLLIIIILLLIFAFLPHAKTWTIGVHVIDSSASDISGANIILQIKDVNLIDVNTDMFGEAKLENFKAKGKVTLFVTKDKYLSQEIKFALSKKELIKEIILEINTDELLISGDNQERVRTVSFVENGTLLVLSPLSVTFMCSKSGKTPIPSYKYVTSGKVTVTQIAGCGELRVNVNSDNYEQISNVIVPSDDKINLTKVLSEDGQLSVKLKNLLGNNIQNGLIKIYATDSPATTIDESEFVLKTANSDIYGKALFDLIPGSYLTTVDAIGYLFLPKFDPLSITLNNTTSIEYTLLTPQNINEFDCSKPLYEPLCNNGEIDCNNPILKPYLTFKDDGTCILGKVGYIDVTLKDQNTDDSVNGDISLWGKIKDTNSVYKYLGKTSIDTNHAIFNVLDTYNYRIVVTNTEENGYIQPEPYDLNSIDQNIIILLEYSSELNSGTIGVNVISGSYNIANANVYLFKKNDNGDILINPTPKITNTFGDVNFPLMKAGKKYYAYAIQPFDNLQGTSLEKKLDANEFLELKVSLTNVPRILNLKVTPQNYDINFFSPSTNDLITDFVVNELPDHNKQYIFTTNTSQIYAILRADGYASYQTEIITIYPGQETYKIINLTSLSACSKANVEFIGLFDESGSNSVTNIDFNNYTLADEYKLKFKYSSCLANKDLSYVHIRSGIKKIIDDDSIVLLGAYYTAQDVDERMGFAFQGELVDWNSSYFSLYYPLDHNYSWNGDGEKWIDLDFTDSNIDQIEFSVNFKFKGDVVPTTDYRISYRALAYDDSLFYLEPTFSGYNNWSIIPNGYFYALTNKYEIPFANLDYILIWALKDMTGTELVKNGNDYYLDIGTNYRYDMRFLHLKNQNKSGNIEERSEYTNNNLIYNSYIFKDKNQVISRPMNNDINILIPDVNSFRGYLFDLNSIFHAQNFFEIGNSVIPKMTANIINHFANISIPVYAYVTGSNYVVQIDTSDLSGNNNIYAGDNDLNFFVSDNLGNPLKDVEIKYEYENYPGIELDLGKTSSDGYLRDKSIAVDFNLIGSNVYFKFVFDANYGFNNSMITITKNIMSGYSIVPDLLNYSAQVVTIEGAKNIMINSQDYNLIKLTEKGSELQTISTIGGISGGVQIIDPNGTNNLIDQVNNLPKLINNESTTIFAPIALMEDNINSNGFVNFWLRNDLQIGTNNNQSIIQEIDVNGNLNINYYGDVTINPIVTSEGMYLDNNEVHLELIKMVKEDINLDYVIKKTAASPVMKINTIVASQTGSPDDINLSKLNMALDQYTDSEITVGGLTITLPISLISSSTTGVDKEINLDFNILFDNTYVLLHRKITYLDILDNDSLFTRVGSNTPFIDCKQISSCNTPIFTYRLKNNTKSYILHITDIVDENNSQIPLELDGHSVLPLDLNVFIDINLIVKSDYNFFAPSYNYSNPNNSLGLDFIYTIAGINADSTKSLNVAITVTSLNPLPPELSLKDNLCLGVGSQKSGNNIFVLASCDTVDDDCVSGKANLPKIRYYWKGSGVTNIAWSGTDPEKDSCITENINGIYTTTNKFYCDSSQMLISVLNRLVRDNCIDNQCVKQYPIYLMADGTSSDLIDDFMSNLDFLGAIGDTGMINSITNIYNSGEFTITRTDNSTQYVPGLYLLDVDYNPDVFLYLTLTKISDLSSNDTSLFYYLPIDGKLGVVDGTRIGYGTNVNYLTNVINPSNIVVSGGLGVDERVEINSFQDPTQLIVANINNYGYTSINSIYFENLQRMNGKLLSLSFENTISGIGLDLTYAPTIPIPVYARMGCPNYPLDYVLKETSDDDTIALSFSPFLSWDYNILNDVGQADDKRMTALNGYYKSHRLDLNEYINIPTDLNYTLLKTMIYLPIGEDGKLSPMDYKLSSSNLNNSNSTNLYNLLAGEKDIILQSNIEDTLVSIENLFTQVEDGNACIYNGASSTYIKWVSEKIDASAARINAIIEDAKNYTDSCGQGNAQIE